MSDVGIVYFARSTHSTLKDLSSLGDVPPQYIDIDHMAYPILRKVMKSIGCVSRIRNTYTCGRERISPKIRKSNISEFRNW
jgi:hypothetical protein